ncbi:insulinase family protein [Micromonospora sp. NPDC005197]|uniref:M16 family metallopeptidase n=1 Tax=Micromonospora sp. NPDC005197 TaxID=3157020 RepID=UPI0033B6C742
MERTEIDGVPVRWKQGPAPLSATLLFGCGARDETFRTIGVTHLIEHLVMSTLPRLHHEHNASVDLHVTEFTATGRPEQIVAFLAAVCDGLRALPLDRLEKEAGVLAAEGGHCTDPTTAALLTQRLGVQGAGLAPWTGPGYDRLTPEQIREYAARWFVAGNAVLLLTGPPPEGLRLPLPAGPRPDHLAPTPVATAEPIWCEHLVPSVGVSLVGDDDAAMVLGCQVLSQRLEQIARRTHGLSYEVGGDVVLLGNGQQLVTVTVDAREGQEPQVAALLWEELNRLATEGPTAAELAEECAAAREMIEDPRAVEAYLHRSGFRELLGLPQITPEQRLADFLAVTPEDVRVRFQAALPSAHLVVPCGVTLSLPGLTEGGCPRLPEQPEGRVFHPPMLAKVLAREARGLRLILTDDGVALRDPDGDVHLVRFDEVVGVEEDGVARTVFGRNGCHILVDPDMFRGAERAVRAVDAAVPASLRYRRSELVGLD